MPHNFISICLPIFFLLVSSLAAGQPKRVNDGFNFPNSDWPWWRGPARMGEAASQTPPLKWSETDNILWKTPIQGRGHGSPTIVGDSIYLSTCEESKGSQMVICLERASGRKKWTTEIYASGAMRKNQKSSGASSTIACDGERLFVPFANNGALTLTALDLTGKILWQQKLTNYVVHQGFGASPALYGSLVIATSDNKGGGAVVAFERATGKEVWRHTRPKTPNYSSPIILNVAGKDQLIMTGCDLVTSLNPKTGDVFWETVGATTECVTSTVTDGTHIYTSGGYPKNHISAVVADGSKKLAWEEKSRVYVPSFVIKEDHLFGVMDAGVAACWKADSGKVLWRSRLGGTFSASPVLVKDLIYVTNEKGETFIYKASSTELEIVAKNQLANEVYATPVFLNDVIYYRGAENSSGKRQEYLYAIEEK